MRDADGDADGQAKDGGACAHDLPRRLMSGDAGSGIEISALPEMSPRSLEGRRAVETLEKEMGWRSVSQYMRPLAAASGSCAPKPGSPAVTLAMVDEEMRVARQRQWDLVCNQLRTPDMEQFKETFGDRCRGDDWPPFSPRGCHDAVEPDVEETVLLDHDLGEAMVGTHPTLFAHETLAELGGRR